jgi:SAM-dependent methyltransferase
MERRMNRAEFDRFADEYHAVLASGIALSGETPEFFVEYKVSDVARLLAPAAATGNRLQVLDFGAGIGASVPLFHKHLPHADITCVDVSMRSLRIGIERFAGAAQFVAFDGIRLPFADGTFDCVFASCVFHHIPTSLHVGLMKEIRRVLRPSGLLAIFEHNPWNLLTVRVVRSCPFDDNAVLISAPELRGRVRHAGFRNAQVRYRAFFPRLLRALRPFESALTWLPLGAQYCVLARR